jgi:hypothetical protein
MNIDKNYRNLAIGDLFNSEKKAAEVEKKLQILETIANKEASTNVWVYAIPAVGLVLMVVLIAISMKKKKVQ